MAISDKEGRVVSLERPAKSPPPEKTFSPEWAPQGRKTLPPPRPMSADRPIHPHRRFSALTRRILFLNAAALFILIAGVLWVQSNRIGLVDERIAGIRDQALIVAGALAEYSAVPDRRSVET